MVLIILFLHFDAVIRRLVEDQSPRVATLTTQLWTELKVSKGTLASCNASLVMFWWSSENPFGSHGIKHITHLMVIQVIYLIDLHLGFPQLPLVALNVPLQLQVVVLKAADQVPHLSVDWP